jgi:hypothetical protein
VGDFIKDSVEMKSPGSKESVYNSYQKQMVVQTTVVYIGDISEISDISPKFSWDRNFPSKMLRHFRNFECVATHSLTREILRKCRGSMESVGLLGKGAEKECVKGF